MSYPLKNKNNKKLNNKTWVIAGLFLVLLFSQYFFGGGIKNFFYTIYRPIWIVEENVKNPFSGIINFFKTKNSIINENLSLKDELTKLKLKESDYDALQKENDELKSQLGRDDKVKKIIANILSKPPVSPYDTFVIDAGAKNSVTLGNKAYISDKIIIGSITEIRDKSSIISLFSKNGVNTGVVLERTGVTYNLVGNGGQNYKLEGPKDTDLLWGDVFTYPDGHRSIVGNVYYIDTNSQSAFKTAYIRPPVNVFSYKTVLIEQN
jgi:cell shape-determining protein MreC